jgi:hypothetical protein
MSFLSKKKSAKQIAKEQEKIEAWLQANEMQDFESTDLNFIKKAVGQLNHDGLADVTMLTGNIGDISKINGLMLRGGSESSF